MRTERSFTVHTLRAVLAVAFLIALLLIAGCGGEKLVAEEGQMTCAECHIDRDLVQADLEADPMPEVAEAESEGEG